MFLINISNIIALQYIMFFIDGIIVAAVNLFWDVWEWCDGLEPQRRNGFR